MKRQPLSSLLYAILIHGIKGDRYSVDDIQDATGVENLRTKCGGVQIRQAVIKCRDRGVIWVRDAVGVIRCAESPNKSRTQCKADPRAVEFV